MKVGFGGVGPAADFFLLGGDSLSALRVGRMLKADSESTQPPQPPPPQVAGAAVDSPAELMKRHRAGPGFGDTGVINGAFGKHPQFAVCHDQFRHAFTFSILIADCGCFSGPAELMRRPRLADYAAHLAPHLVAVVDSADVAAGGSLEAATATPLPPAADGGRVASATAARWAADADSVLLAAAALPVTIPGFGQCGAQAVRTVLHAAEG